MAVFYHVTKRDPTLKKHKFYSYLTPEHFIAVRTLPGGPAPVAIERSLAQYKSEIDWLKRVLDGALDRKHQSDQLLEDAVASLIRG